MSMSIFCGRAGRIQPSSAASPEEGVSLALGRASLSPTGQCSSRFTLAPREWSRTALIFFARSPAGPRQHPLASQFIQLSCHCRYSAGARVGSSPQGIASPEEGTWARLDLTWSRLDFALASQPRIRNPPPILTPTLSLIRPSINSDSDSARRTVQCGSRFTLAPREWSGLDCRRHGRGGKARLARTPDTVASSTRGIRAPADSEGVQTAVRLRGWLGWHQGQRQLVPPNTPRRACVPRPEATSSSRLPKNQSQPGLELRRARAYARSLLLYSLATSSPTRPRDKLKDIDTDNIPANASAPAPRHASRGSTLVVYLRIPARPTGHRATPLPPEEETKKRQSAACAASLSLFLS
ncbi:hypothetical protein FB451DRAFT_1472268 [Mycena latifolia]|nr:hypothetical protein FB451DRAFT_1472268 [Mycena latifolia]